MTARDERRLVGVYPALVTALKEVFAEMERAACPMFVVEGLRTVARQQELYAQGRTAHGAIVTYKDGVTHRSNHQPRADGYGHAVDCAFVSGDPFASGQPWERYGIALEQRGVVWGGRWKMRDTPHAEWPDLPQGTKTA